MKNIEVERGLNTLKVYLEKWGIEYQENVVMGDYLTMGIGGTVPMVVIVKEESHLRELFIYIYRVFRQREAQPGGIRMLLLGGGSNIVFPDGMMDLVVVINRTGGIKKESEGILRVNSGVMIGDLMNWNIQNGVGGMDFLAGIPGTVGGAAAVNAGAFGQSMSSLVERADIVSSSGEYKTVAADYFQFTYRDSVFKLGEEVIVNVYLGYVQGDGQDIKNAVDSRLRYRYERHPGYAYRSAGCFFKNPIIEGEKISAGRLLEQAGFKGMSADKLLVSEAHANFIINRGGASFSELEHLEQSIKAKVLQREGIELEREVIFISPDGKKY